MTDYLIIGNGVAGTTAAENIRKLDKTGKITVVTEESTPFYYRMRLPEFISGDLTEDKLSAKKDQWYKDQGIELETEHPHPGCRPREKSGYDSEQSRNPL